MAGHIQHKYAVRLQTVLLRVKGKGTGEIAEFLGIHQSTVGLYITGIMIMVLIHYCMIKLASLVKKL